MDWSVVVQDRAGPVSGRCEQDDEPACNCVAVIGAAEREQDGLTG